MAGRRGGADVLEPIDVLEAVLDRLGEQVLELPPASRVDGQAAVARTGPAAGRPAS